MLDRILKKSGIRRRKIHDLWHTYASQLLSLGASPLYVKEQLGHQQIATTMDIYGKWIPSDTKGAVNLLSTHEKARHRHEKKKVHPVTA